VWYAPQQGVAAGKQTRLNPARILANYSLTYVICQMFSGC